MSILDHLERYLGPMAGGWRPKVLGGAGVLLFADRPFKDALTFVTHGLSAHELRMPDGRGVRLELMLSCWKDTDQEALASFLGGFADEVVMKHRPLLAGDVVGPRGPIIHGTSMSALYVSVPVIFDRAIGAYKETSPPTVLVWLIPLYAEEADYVGTHGWNAFEDLLESKDPDLLDFTRHPVVERGHGKEPAEKRRVRD